MSVPLNPSLITGFDSGGADRLELFHTRSGQSFADVYRGGLRQTLPVLSESFRDLLLRRMHETTSKVPTMATVRRVATLIDAEARQPSVPERDVFLRAATANNRVFVDVCDNDWSVIEIGPAEWKIVQNPPVRFTRTPVMAPLPFPEKGGSIELLGSLLNFRAERDLVLVVSWLLDALRNGCSGHPPLITRGPEGTAKSTALSILQALVDPSSVPPGPLPTTERALIAHMNQTYLQAFDNARILTGAVSDALCRLSTGTGSRPVLINGIEEVVKRPDLVDRCLFVDCEVIRDDRRRSHAELSNEFVQNKAKILGVLCDAVSHGLRVLPSLRVDRLPRMADFALWATACERALWPPGTFASAYQENMADAVERVLEADPLVSALRVLVKKRSLWNGTAAELDALLRALSGNIEQSEGWPADPARLGQRLRQRAMALDKLGVSITFSQVGHTRTRIISIASKAVTQHVTPAVDATAGNEQDTPAQTSSPAVPVAASGLPNSGSSSGMSKGDDLLHTRATEMADTADSERGVDVAGGADGADSTDTLKSGLGTAVAGTDTEVSADICPSADAMDRCRPGSLESNDFRTPARRKRSFQGQIPTGRTRAHIVEKVRPKFKCPDEGPAK